MADTKQEILGLLGHQERSAQDLAQHLAMTPAGVRQHLAALEAQGLIVHRKLGGEPNRPTYLYSLSEAGKATFPKAYALLTNMLLRRAKGELGTDETEKFVQRAGAEAAAGLENAGPRAGHPSTGQPIAEQSVVGQSSLVERARAALAVLDETLPERCDFEPTPDGVRITVYQCPIQAVAQQHPESCPAFFRGLLGAALQVRETPREGVACCTILAES
jgi:predicted ArsR family transcriptional regulator